MKNEPLPFERVPVELKQVAQWVLWQGKKIPIDPKTGNAASVTNPETWGSFDEALAGYESGMGKGIGFVFTADDPYCGIDLDGCRDSETGKIQNWALAIVLKFDSYTEVSPSKTGFHIIARGSLPDGGRRKGSLEMYDEGRYFTITGDWHKGPSRCIPDMQAEIDELHRKTFGDPVKASSSVSRPSTPCLDDEASLERAFASKHGDSIRALWEGRWEEVGYSSQSEADLAFCSHLAFWFGRDAARVDSMFRRSGLMRPKWDEKHGDRTYGEMTVAKAIEGGGEVYSGPGKSENSTKTEPRKKLVSANTEMSGPAEVGPDIVCLASIEPEEVSWLFHPYFPRGKVSLIEGDPGSGKTFVMLNIAALVTKGFGFPDDRGTPHAEREPENALYVTCEDGLADTVRPRFDAIGGDASRLFALRGKTDGTAFLLSDTETLEKGLREYRPSLVVIDPIQGFLGGIDMHRANEVRPLLAGIGRLAEEYQVAIVCVRHLRKAGADKAIHRGLGSIDFTAHARSVLQTGRDPKNPDDRALVHTKSSLAPEGPSVGYEIRDDRLRWIGMSDLTAQDLNAPEPTRSRKDSATEFLENELADGPMSANEVRAKANEHGIADRTLDRAKKKIGVTSKRSGFGPGSQSLWALPGTDLCPSQGRIEDHSPPPSST